MSRKYSEVLLEALAERARLLRDWRRLVREAARAVKALHPEARIYLTGSIAEGRWIAASDIDLVVVLDHEPSMREAARIIEHVWRQLGLPPEHPLEIHVVGPKTLEAYPRKGRMGESSLGEGDPWGALLREGGSLLRLCVKTVLFPIPSRREGFGWGLVLGLLDLEDSHYCCC